MVMDAVRGYWSIAHGLADQPRQRAARTTVELAHSVGVATQDEVRQLHAELDALRERLATLEAAVAAGTPAPPRRRKKEQ